MHQQRQWRTVRSSTREEEEAAQDGEELRTIEAPTISNDLGYGEEDDVEFIDELEGMNIGRTDV